MTVTEVPEVLAKVMETPLGGGELSSRRDLKKDGFDSAIFVVGWAVSEARHEAGDSEGHKEMSIVDKVDGEHGRALQEVAFGDGLEAEGSESNALGWIWDRGLRAGGTMRSMKRSRNPWAESFDRYREDELSRSPSTARCAVRSG